MFRKIGLFLAACLFTTISMKAWAQAAGISGNNSQPTPTTTANDTPPTTFVDGWFTQGNQAQGGIIPATIVPSWWLNKVGGEIDSAIQGLGGTLSMTTRNQLLTRMQASFANITGSTSNQFDVSPATSSNPAAAVSLSQFVASFGTQGSITLPNGFILKWGSAMTVANGTVSSFAEPSAFPNNNFFCVVSFGSSVPPISGSVGCDPNGNSAVNITNTYTNGLTYGVHFISIGD